MLTGCSQKILRALLGKDRVKLLSYDGETFALASSLRIEINVRDINRIVRCQNQDVLVGLEQKAQVVHQVVAEAVERGRFHLPMDLDDDMEVRRPLTAFSHFSWVESGHCDTGEQTERCQF